ncbi:MAG: SWIM zinc finger family protein [Bacillota bacterium]|nr:SWIM zinc finger family protein [Bacillota bacterium]
MARWDYDDHYYPPSRPRQAKGGIKARTRRGTFGESWWARRWIEVLEGFDTGARLDRGRSYARKGQVLEIEVEEGVVRAKVQGSRLRPYDVTIKIKPLSERQWRKVGRSLSGEAMFAAKLLSGEMPETVEDAFKAAGVSLFPERKQDLRTGCSCPDWSNPCKHVAAVYYLLGEEFDRDPFLIFKLRGMTREGLLHLIDGVIARQAKKKTQRDDLGSRPEVEPEQETSPPTAALAADVLLFWGERDSDDDGPVHDGFGQVRIPTVAASWVRRLGAFPFWQGHEDLLAVMGQVYLRASPLAMDVFLGERCTIHGAARQSTSETDAGEN